ncbi:MAG: amidoligase family protein [Myxococcota bacterium]
MSGWPREVDFRQLRFGVELEFAETDASRVVLPRGWSLDPSERMLAMTGEFSGGEIKPSPLRWAQREGIAAGLRAIAEAGGVVNWSCGLHVHVDLASWGSAVLPAVLEAALQTQSALRELFATAEHRMLYCPAVTAAQCDAHAADPCEAALRHAGRPEAARSGINVSAWYDFGTVELRYPNATLDPESALRCVELCLRWVSAVGAGVSLPSEAQALAAALDMPGTGYPPPHPQPVWHRREEQLTELMIPILQPMCMAERPGARILFVRPTPEGLYVKTDSGNEVNHRFWFRPHAAGFELLRIEDPPLSDIGGGGQPGSQTPSQ